MVMLTAAVTASAQRHKLTTINAETEEGKALQAVTQETDPAKRIGMMEAYASKFGKHESTAWVLSQLQAQQIKAGNPAKAIEAGAQLLALDPMDLDAAYANLKASEAAKDSEGVSKWSGVTSQIARKTAETPKQSDESEDDHKRAVDYAKQVDTYTEYALYLAALQSADAPKVILLTETLEQRNPQSQYIPQLMEKYAGSARQANAMPKAVAFGERAFGRNQFNADMRFRCGRRRRPFCGAAGAGRA